MIMHLDIETLPAGPESDGAMKSMYDKYQEKSFGANKKTFEEFVASTSFDGAFGRILCIGYAMDDGAVDVVYDQDEKKILEKFWELARSVNLFVGHNAFDFDMPFIYQRSIVFGVEPTKQLSFRRFAKDEIFDTMQEWNRWGRSHSSGSLHKLALAFGLPTSKGDIDGSQVYDYFRAGKVDDILEYCKKDVVLTRQVFHRLTFNKYKNQN